jgi:hypothetical protein
MFDGHAERPGVVGRGLSDQLRPSAILDTLYMIESILRAVQLPAVGCGLSGQAGVMDSNMDSRRQLQAARLKQAREK